MGDVRTYPAGVTSWVDLQVDDVEAAKAFYGGLFGWTFIDVGPPGGAARYVIARLDGQDVAGIGGPSGTPGSWETYVAVDNAELTAKLVTESEGRVLTEAAPAGDGGILAVCTDPSGIGFRLWQANRRPGAQIANVPGAWNFSELHTADPSGAMAFYATVFGWEFDDAGFATLVRRPGYGDHLAATIDPGIHERQTAVGAPPGFADATAWIIPAAEGTAPRWHVSFTVANRDETVAAATRLDATVISTNDTEWTKDALLQDPQGAELTASQFAPPE